MFTRPANDVGGDLVDCLSLADRRVAFMLADVAGKALPAALLMAKVQATLRALATETPSLPALAARTNQILHRDGLPNRFATMVYAEITDGDGTVRLVNAGHMPPWSSPPAASTSSPGRHRARPDSRGGLRRAGGRSRAWRDALHLLGRPDRGDERGRRVLRRLEAAGAVPADPGPLPADAGKRVIAEIDRFIGSRRPYDDVSMVILRRR